jgi:beta-1,2-mannobiose phosphorylase / 1,2-beta-oligomannan phosphorylase
MIQLRRSEANPILVPVPEHDWEAGAVFNPAAVVRDGEVQLLYRAAGTEDHYVSRLGLATSTDGSTFRRVSDEPVFEPAESYERYSIEDPRLLDIDGTLYMTYVVLELPAFSFGQRASTALASTDDLRSWRRHGIITPSLPGVDDRDTVLFPGKVDDRYVMLHRPQMLEGSNYVEYGTGNPSSIWISHSDDLDRPFPPGEVLLPAEQPWEARKIGIGPPPLRTERGWLLLYHGVDLQNVYRAGAALVALDNPQKVLGRLPYPILEPEASYERVGPTPCVVFPEGAVVLNDELLVYYGCADQTCAMAHVPLDELLDALEGAG